MQKSVVVFPTMKPLDGSILSLLTRQNLVGSAFPFQSRREAADLETITSRANPLLIHIKKLAASAAYRRERRMYLGDSPKLLAEALKWHAPIREVVAAKGIPLPGLPCDVRTVQVPEDVMASISPMKSPQGVLFTVTLPETGTPEALTGSRYIVLDGVQDPGNVGTILRTLDAFDFDGLILLEGCADPWSVKTVRSSMGAVFRRPVWCVKAAELPALLSRSGLPLYGTALREDTEDVRDVALDRCAIVIGSEGQGISGEVLTMCRKTLKIPMSQRCESLNAAIAAAVLLWESYR